MTSVPFEEKSSFQYVGVKLSSPHKRNQSLLLVGLKLFGSQPSATFMHISKVVLCKHLFTTMLLLGLPAPITQPVTCFQQLSGQTCVNMTGQTASVDECCSGLGGSAYRQDLGPCVQCPQGKQI